MSTLNAPSHTVVDKIPLGQRIAEIMKEKGGYYSISAMSKRLGIDRDTYGKMLKGERQIFTFEFEKIAMDLKVEIDRIMQEDIIRDYENIKLSIQEKKLGEALTLNEKLLSLSLGASERCEVQYIQAQIFYELREFKKAHEALLHAYKFAAYIAEKFGSQDKLHNVLSKLIITSSMRKDFTNLIKVFDRVETVFQSDPKKYGSLCFSRAMLAENVGDIGLAREYLEKSLDCYKLTGNQLDIGRALLNLGYFEFKLKNYMASKELLRNAVINLESDGYYRYVGVKEYVKSMIQLGEKEEATKLIRDSLDYIDEFADLKGKFLVLYSISTETPIFAEAVLNNTNVGKGVMGLAYKFLLNYFLEHNDAKSYMRYSKMANEYLSTNTDLIHEEDL